LPAPEASREPAGLPELAAPTASAAAKPAADPERAPPAVASPAADPASASAPVVRRPGRRQRPGSTTAPSMSWSSARATALRFRSLRGADARRRVPPRRMLWLVFDTDATIGLAALRAIGAAPSASALSRADAVVVRVQPNGRAG
jgi:hypothetical protein